MAILSGKNLSRKKISIIIIILIFLISLIIVGSKLTKAGDPASWDLLDEDCAGISDWIDNDYNTGVSEVSPAGQFRFDTNNGAAGNAKASRNKDFGSTPNTFTAEIKIYCDDIGLWGDVDKGLFVIKQADEQLQLQWGSDGLFIEDTDDGWAEIGTDLIKEGGSAEWQTFRFLVTFTGTTGDGTCDIYLNDSTHNWEKVATGKSCSYEIASTDGQVVIQLAGYTTNNMVMHVDYIKIASGLYIPPAPGPTDLKSLNDVVKADIKSIGGVSIGDIKSIGGIE